MGRATIASHPLIQQRKESTRDPFSRADLIVYMKVTASLRTLQCRRQRHKPLERSVRTDDLSEPRVGYGFTVPTFSVTETFSKGELYAAWGDRKAAQIALF